MKAYGEVKIKLQAFLISKVDGGEWSHSHSDHLAPRYPSHRRHNGPRSRVGRRGGKEKQFPRFCSLKPKAYIDSDTAAHIYIYTRTDS
jgi:hypothetical protein